METLKKITKDVLDKIEVNKMIRCLKAKLQIKMNKKYCKESVKRTYFKLYKLFISQVQENQDCFKKSFQTGSITLYFTDDNAQIIFKNYLIITIGSIYNQDLYITPEQINLNFNNYYNGKSNFKYSKEIKLVKNIIKNKTLEWQSTIICRDDGTSSEFICRFTPGTIALDLKVEIYNTYY